MQFYRKKDAIILKFWLFFSWAVVSYLIVVVRIFEKISSVFMIYLLSVFIYDISISAYFTKKLETHIFEKFGSWERLFFKLKNTYGYKYVPSKYNWNKVAWFVKTPYDFDRVKIEKYDTFYSHKSPALYNYFYRHIFSMNA